MSNIIDKIQLSGITYDIGGQGGSGVSVIEVSQAEYDALPSSAKTDTSKMYVITDAEAGDLTNYYTKTETNTLLGGKADSSAVTEEISAAVSGKVDTTTYTAYTASTDAALATKQTTLTAGTGIDITDNVISVTGGGSVTIDSSFDRNSENAISNKVVSRGTIGSYGLASEGSGENLRNIIQAYDQGGYGISDKNLVYTNINNKPVISIYSNKNNVPYNIEVVETSAITTSVTSSSTDAQVPSAKAVYDALGSAGGGISSAECQTMIDQSISGKADSDDVYTTGQTSGATELATAFAATQPKLSAGTGISIDANNVISATGGGGGGGGKAIEAGRGISITTGETANTVSFNLPMSADTIGLAFFNSKDGGEISSGNSVNKNNLVLSGCYNKIGGNGSKREFSGNFISGWGSKIFDNTYAYDYGAKYNIIFGSYNTLSGNGNSVISSIIVGDFCYGYAKYQSLFGFFLQAQNISEHSIGQYNVSNKANTTFGDSGNTLFSVGNGTAENARHNAFEIRQNGDIYYFDGTNDVKLQDKLSSLDTTIGNINTILESI